MWVNDLYSVSFAAFAIPAAKIGDRYGVTFVYKIGIVGFVLMSFMCGCSKYITYQMTPWAYGGLWVLLVSRCIQGIFAAFLMATTMAMSALLVEQNKISTAMAFNAIGFSVGTALGPTLGGVLV